MKIIALADIHGSIGHLPEIAGELENADLVLIAGDITTFGDEPQAHKILYAISDYNNQILAVHGNCDPPAVEEYLEIHENALDRRCVALDGITFAGLGGALQYHGSNRNQSPEDDFTYRLDTLKSLITSNGPFVFVSHHPAYGTRLDSVGAGKHAGSTAIREFIEDTKPILAISGHVHEAVATDNLNGTTLVNPGPFKEGCYATIRIENRKVVDARTHSLR